MERGYIALWRKSQDHPFYQERREFSKWEAWIDILMEVQHSLKPKKIMLGMDVFICNYGESLKSLRTWGIRWGWSPTKVKRFFELLKKMKQISIKNETQTTRLTVLNYGRYDPKRNANETRPKHDRNTDETRPLTDNNVKNVYSDKLTTFVGNYINYIKKTYPTKSPSGKNVFNKSLDTIEKLIRIDRFDEEYIFNVIRWAQQDDFWSSQLYSLAMLRRKSNSNGLTKFQNVSIAYDKTRPEAPTETELVFPISQEDC